MILLPLCGANEISSDAEIFNNATHKPIISGYVDMLSVQGDDKTDDQIPPAYETGYKSVQTKNIGIRRIRFQDTDDNSADAEAANYKGNDVSAIFPHCVEDGEWGDELTTIIGEINAVRKTVPKFYATYCTSETVSTLSDKLGMIDAELSGDANIETLSGLKSQLEAALKNVKFKYDSKIAQVYVATDKGNGASYGTSLTKAIGYVPAQMVVVSTDGSIMASDLSWAGQIKVRGNSTAYPAKKPYNMKFSSKVDLFGLGKAKKWCLLADYYDPTLMRNKICLDVAEKLGLEATPGNQRVEVWVDGLYRGMYLLTEKIEEDKNRVNIDTDNGDFLLEVDASSRQETGNVYFSSSSGRFFRLREPEDEAQVATVKAKVDEFETVLKSGNWDQISRLIDLDSFVSYYVLNEFMKTIDFAGLSVFFYCKDGKFYGGPAWDFDRSSGNGSSGYGTIRLSPEGIYAGTCHYYTYLFKFPEFQLAASQKLAEISEFVKELYKDSGVIDSEASLHAAAIAREHTVWPVTLSRGMRQQEATYEGNTAFLKNWLASRHEWITDYFLNRVYISSEAFPDANFLAYVKTLDTNSNSFLDSSELKAITSLNVSGLNIASLQGLKYFTSLTALDCTNNPLLSELDISNCPLLFLRGITHDTTTTINGATKPEFAGHSLLLSGQIGLDFYIRMPDELINDDVYMQFTINGEAQTPAMLYNADDLGNNEYRFTCFINSVQMADVITAELHCLETQTFTQTYRVKDYTDTALAQIPAASEDLRALISAIKDYGHYVQPPLAEYNKWTLGVKHHIMDCANSNIASDSADVRRELEDYAIVKDTGSSGISSVEYNLELDSETALNVYLVPKSEYLGSVSAYLGDSKENMAVKQPNGEYRVQISGISAHKLGDTYTIHVVAGGEFDIKVSALSYADTVMKSSSASTDLKKAAIALYNYYDATMNYRASPDYKQE